MSYLLYKGTKGVVKNGEEELKKKYCVKKRFVIKVKN
jgi:hypothetical protein